MAGLLARAVSAVGWFLGRYLAAIAALYGLSMVTARAGVAARMLASWLALVACALFGVVASVVLRLGGGDHWQSAQWMTARAFKYAMMALTGVTFAVEDPADVLGTTRPAVFVGNHQSALDVLMLGCMFPRYCSVTAKRQLRNYPFLGWFMRLSGTIFIDRANSRDAREALRGAANVIRTQRQSVFMFPEGTRSYAQEPLLLPFKKGAFHLAVQAGVPIVPVVVANYSHVYSSGTFLPSRIPVKVLDPIPTKNLTADDVTALTTRVHDLMLAELVRVTAQARAEAAAASKTTAPKAAVAVPVAVAVPAPAADDKSAL